MKKIIVGAVSVILLVGIGVATLSFNPEEETIKEQVDSVKQDKNDRAEVNVQEEEKNEPVNTEVPNTEQNENDNKVEQPEQPEQLEEAETVTKATPDSTEDINQEGEEIVKEKKFDELKPFIKKGKKIESKFKDLSTTLQQTSVSKQPSFTFTIHNRGQQDITIQFPSSQAYEYEIYKETGEFVYRYSDGKMFMQVIKDKMIPANKSITFEITIPTLEKGNYYIVMWPSAREMGQFKEKLSFTIN